MSKNSRYIYAFIYYSNCIIKLMTFIIHLPGKDDHQKDFNMSYGEKMEICVNEKYNFSKT